MRFKCDVEVLGENFNERQLLYTREDYNQFLQTVLGATYTSSVDYELKPEFIYTAGVIGQINIAGY